MRGKTLLGIPITGNSKVNLRSTYARLGFLMNSHNRE